MTSATRGSYTLLALLVSLVLWLGAEAIRSSQEQRRSADRVLREYAGIAAWYFRSAWRADWDGELMSALGPVVAEPLTRPGDTLPALSTLMERARGLARCPDQPRDSLRYYFRYDHRSGELMIEGTQPAAALRHALLDSLRAAADLTPPDFFAFTLTDGLSRGRIVLAGQKPGPDGRAVATFGLETCGRALGRNAFPRVFGRYPLLPASRVGEIPNDSALSVVVTRGAEGEPGETLFASVPQYPGTYRSQLAEHSAGMGLRFEAHLRPDLAPRLVMSGSRGRTVWQVVLLVATLGLTGVVVAQIRRERQLVRARTDFVTSVSHELRTPLAQIRLFAESLKLGSARSEQERTGALDVILQESQRLFNLVENVLHFTRFDRGGRTPFPEALDLSSLAREVVDGFEPLVRDRGIRFQLMLGSGVQVQVEPGPTRQILLNLLDNAAKFSPAGHPVTVSTWLEQGWACLAVEDEGPGIPPADREAIWLPFVRLRANASRAPGSGIGLAVVRDLVRRQNGLVSVGEGAAGGARFVVRFHALRVPIDLAPVQ